MRFTEETADDIVASYVSGTSLSRLGHEHGCCLETIRKILKRRGVPRRPRGNTYRKLSPAQVADIGRRWQTGESQSAIATSVGCSQAVISRVLLKAGYEPVARRPRGSQHSSWTGGRVVLGGGYIGIYVARDDPLFPSAQINGYMLEHRYVVATTLGRPLVRSETVHHINGDRTDNRPENLQLRQGRHGNGKAMRCADCGSHNLVNAPPAEPNCTN